MDGNSYIRSSFVLSFVVKIRPLMDGNWNLNMILIIASAG